MSEGQNIPGDEAHLRALNMVLREENEALRAIVETLKRALYGARSEKQAAPETQLPLALGDLSLAAVEPADLPCRRIQTCRRGRNRHAISAACRRICRAWTLPSSRRSHPAHAARVSCI
jgi:hypothetical protein